MAALISGHPVKKQLQSTSSQSVLQPQNSSSILFCGIVLSNLFRVFSGIWQCNVEIRK